MKEYFDVVNAEGTPTGEIRERGTELKNGEYHLVTSVWVINRMGKILITKRSHTKSAFPDLWENTSGYVQAGETTKEAAARELFEETGISASNDSICFIGTTRRGHTIADSFVLESDIQDTDNDIHLQLNETQDALLVYADEIERMIQENLFAEPVIFRLKAHLEPLNRTLKKYTDITFNS